MRVIFPKWIFWKIWPTLLWSSHCIPSCNVISKYLSQSRSWVLACIIFAQIAPSPKRIFFGKLTNMTNVQLLDHIMLECARVFLKISRAVACVILIQIGPKLPKKWIFLEKWLRLLFSSASSCHKTSKRSSESESWETRLHNFEPNWAQIALAQKGNFFFVNWLILLWSNYRTPIILHFKIFREPIMINICLGHNVA